jgi:hypothetical protein
MAERRSLVDGLKADPVVESEFVFGTKAKPRQIEQKPPETPAAQVGKGKGANAIGRAPLTVRFRSDFAAALKRASLERQLNGVVPHTLQDILEEAVEPWLRAKGYLSEGPA